MVKKGECLETNSCQKCDKHFRQQWKWKSGVNPTKLWFLLFSDFYSEAWVFLAQENIVCTLKWPRLIAKNGNEMESSFYGKKVW